MATKTKGLDVKGFTEPVKEFSRLVKETYINALDFSLAVAEENKKLLNKQINYTLGAEEEFAKSIKGFHGQVPVKELPFGKVDTKSLEDGIERFVEVQKSVLESAKGITDNVEKESHTIAKQNVEKAFSLFDEALDSIKV